MGVKKETENSCRFCSKIFCCVECRNAHEESKHPKSSCALCMKENLQFKAPDQNESGTDISEFLYHLAVYHLPLYCKLCGSKYFSGADLAAATPCSWWRKRDSAKPPQTPRATPSSAAISSCDLMELTADAAEHKQPLTPAKRQFQPGDNKSFLSAVEARLKQQSLQHLKQHSSPPELMRQTSTPVHGGLAGQPGQKQPYCPQFVFKTPSCEQLTFDTTGSACSRGTVSSSSAAESKYYTGHSNGFDAVVARFNLESDNTRDNNSPMTSILKKQLEPTPEQQEKKLERSILKPDVLDRITRINESGEKRVRFSDQCNRASVSTTTAEEGDLDAEADNEIFFEARDTLDDEGARKDNNRAEDGDRDSPTSSTSCFEKLVTHLEEKRQTSVVVESCESTASQSSSVVMMLLVGQTDSKNLSSLDLGPLIDSGLEKLKESVASANSSNTNKVTVISSVVNKVECLTTSLDNGSASASKPTRESQQESSPEEQPIADSSTRTTDGYKSDGIFSAVARVFRSALKKLPAVSSATSRNLAREPLSQTGFSPRSVQPTSSSYNSSRQASPVVPRSVNSVTAVASQHFLQRSASKRPRERADSNEEPATAAESSSSGSRSSEIVSSPAAKRHRGWYRIKMREPIARMREQRQIASPRGASLETQRFQQGSLTVGDQFVPLPSRAAHQSTQTGD